MSERGDLEKKVEKLEAECERLRRENDRLRNQPGLAEVPDSRAQNAGPGTPALTQVSGVDEKISLFRSLFHGREDIYPVRWENRQGRSGYSPTCAREWDRRYCGKPRVKCAECEHREFLPVTDAVIHRHLSGEQTVGVYPLSQDETCRFLAVDFDKSSWRDDVVAFLQSCEKLGVPAALERSRSGNGGHVWIFFDSPVPAALARKLGAAILTHTMERRPGIGLESYDRFFPSQDTLPKGGFGNLIALPLQGKSRKEGNTVFLDRGLRPHNDQWSFLSALRRVKSAEAERIVEMHRDGVGAPGVFSSSEESGDPWVLPPSGSKSLPLIEGDLPDALRVVLSNQIFIEKEGLPPALQNRLIRLAAFQNPEFYRAQAMRLNTFDKPRIIACAEDYPRRIGLPRGCLEQLASLLEDCQIQIVIEDERIEGTPITVAFHGVLRPEQKPAADALLAEDIGLLSAATGFGKTVVAAWVIAERRVNTLVLVHRRHLLEQWRERLAAFFDVPIKQIGQIGGGRRRPTGEIDIAVIQSLGRKGEVDDLVAEYGQVVVDEAHHLSAFSFERVLKQVRARYVLGLTATPVRKDGHHPIIFMQCGPIRYRVSDKEQRKRANMVHRVIPRATEFQYPTENAPIQALYASLAVDEARNDLIFDDVLKALEEGRSPLLLTERTGHLEIFADRLRRFAKHVVVLKGGLGKKAHREVMDKLAQIPAEEERVIIATGRYIGEGFDDARLDTLFLTMPISWRGTLQQYVGRLHRRHTGKYEARVYDYIDQEVPVLRRMYERRLKGYRAMGYEVVSVGDVGPETVGAHLFAGIS